MNNLQATHAYQLYKAKIREAEEAMGRKAKEIAAQQAREFNQSKQAEQPSAGSQTKIQHK